MGDYISQYRTSPATTFVLGADRIGQSQSGNYTTVRVYIRANNGPGGSTGSFYGGAGQHLGAIDGVTGWFGRDVGSNFLPSGYANGAQRWYHSIDVNIGHGADGTRGGITLRMRIHYGNNQNQEYTAWFNDFPRIPKVPDAPTPIGIDEVTSDSFRYRFSGNGDGGSGILEWQAQAATNSAFSANVVTVSSGGTTTFTGLLPGNTYYARSRGRNAVGWGPWSSVLSTYVGLPAPTLNSWSQNATDGLVASWSPPSVTTGLTGYRVQVATNSTFTAGVQNYDVGNVTTHTVTGLAGGRQYWARVAARTAGGVNAYSGSRNTMLVLAAGDLDGWTRVGTKPANIAYYTNEGIRRGVVGTRQALYMESLATGAVTLPADTFGMQKVITGLTVGKAYRFTARANLGVSTTADSYRLRVVNESSATPVTVTVAGADLGIIEFVADATSATLQVLLAESVTVPGAQDVVENIAVHSIKLLELNTDYPQRLRGTVYESNLANHFDLACNSVGATWYVGKDGVTRFRLPGAALPVSARFSDEVDSTAASYIDIQAGYDTKTTVNYIEATNYGVDAEGVNEENDTLVVEDTASQAAVGLWRSSIATNLYDEAPYADSFVKRLTDLLDEFKTPQARVSSIVWNAQEDLELATALDVGQRINVRYRGRDYDSQIVSIHHDLTPTRWIVTLQLQPL